MEPELRIQQEGLSDRKSQLGLIMHRYEEQERLYKDLCHEVVYILEKRFRSRRIEFLEVSWRVKSLDSFLEKVRRKGYNDPLNDNKDFVGVRVVLLYKGDVAKVEAIIRKEFQVLDVTDKPKEMGVDRFGYIAKHYIAELNPMMFGARYEDLEHLEFEIQIRTAFVDTFAKIDQRLRIYKHESELPDELLRERNFLFGACEDLDNRISELRRKIEEARAGSRSSLISRTETYALSR